MKGINGPKTKEIVISGVKQALKNKSFESRSLRFTEEGSVFEKFCEFASDHVNDELVPVGLNLGLELALYDFMQLKEYKMLDKEILQAAMRKCSLSIAWLFGDEFFGEYQKIYDSINKQLGVMAILHHTMTGNTGIAREIAESITRVDTVSEDTSGAVAQSELTKGHIITTETINGRAKGTIINLHAGGNILEIRMENGEIVKKLRVECNHIKGNKKERYIKKDSSSDAKVINSMAYFQQGKKFFGANVGISTPPHMADQYFKKLLSEYEIQVRTTGYKEGDRSFSKMYEYVYVEPTDTQNIMDLLTLADDLGCEVFGVTEIDNEIPLLKDFLGKGGNADYYKSNNKERALKLLQSEKGYKAFSIVIQKFCMDYGFDKALEFLDSLYNSLSQTQKNEDIVQRNIRGTLNDSALKDFILKKTKFVIEYAKALDKYNVNKTQSYLIQQLRNPYDRNTHSYKSLARTMGVIRLDAKSNWEELRDITAVNTRLALNNITQKYEEFGLPFAATEKCCGYEDIFKFVMQQLGFRIDKGYSISEDELYAIKREFNTYGLDETSDYSGQKKSRTEVLQKVKK